MVSKPQSVRFAAADRALVEAEMSRTGASFTDVIGDCIRGHLGSAKPLPAAARAPGAKAAPAAPGERDPRPRLKEGETAGAAKGGGLVSDMALPVGNTRPPYQKGQGAQGKGKR